MNADQAGRAPGRSDDPGTDPDAPGGEQDPAAHQRLPFGSDIWTTEPSASVVLYVSVDIYGAKRARLWSGGERDCDFLNLQVGDHAQLSGPTYCWEELAEVLNEALRQHRLYRERIADRAAREGSAEVER